MARTGRGRPARTQRRSWIVGQADVLKFLIPKAPWQGAIIVLVAFLLAAVPLDGWLIRRSLRRGMRGRAGAIRYPAIVLASTAAALAVAGHASGGDLRTWRVDIVDLGPDGTGKGESVLLTARGRSGRVAFDAGEAAVVEVRDAAGIYGERSVEAILTARSDTSLPLSSGFVATAPWDALWLRTAWIPRDIPSIVPPAIRCEEPQVPEADGMALRECGARAWRLRHDHADHLATILGMEHEDADVMLVWKRRLGPELTLDGRSTDEGPTYTLVRYRFPPDVRPSPPPEVVP